RSSRCPPGDAMQELLERERELAAVEELLERGGSVLVVEGGAGIGETALLGAAGRRAAELGDETPAARGAGLGGEFRDCRVRPRTMTSARRSSPALPARCDRCSLVSPSSARPTTRPLPSFTGSTG